MRFDLTEIKDKKEWIQSETEKFSQRGKLSYKVRNQLIEIINEVEEAEKHLKWYGKNMSPERFEQFEKDLKVCKEEIIPLAKNLKQYKSFQESTLHDYIRVLAYEGAKREDSYYIAKSIVQMVNAYWDITDEKPANRIAWGWEKCTEKDNPMAYLYGCIRNYLKRNGKFDKDEFNGIWSGRTL